MKKYKYIGESDEMTTNGKIYDVQKDGSFVDDTNSLCYSSDDFEKYFELVENPLTQLLQYRKDLKAIEKETESYVVLNDLEMQNKHYTTKKLRKKTEKAIFKILEDGTE